ncbi:hypothetical protein [Flavobacterium sp.]|uniref:hypothetical protein n=1 Tax=Flavobacterium sp. TaxID=239 RepID=UPI00122478BC|nr:hypothetical protein [Flavobacterium sp.]RZJ70375.1 MAG: hypothetical protein EOO49_13920 [Flavobacterium sp.]
MKRLCFGFILLAVGCSQKTPDCKSVHDGKFIITDPGFKCQITRNDGIQIEQGKDFKTQFDVEWKDDCHYTLKNRKSLSGDETNDWKPENEFLVEITEVTSDRIFFTMTANFTDARIDSSMKILE